MQDGALPSLRKMEKMDYNGTFTLSGNWKTLKYRHSNQFKLIIPKYKNTCRFMPCLFFILFNLLECVRMLFIFTFYVWLMRFLA